MTEEYSEDNYGREFGYYGWRLVWWLNVTTKFNCEDCTEEAETEDWFAYFYPIPSTMKGYECKSK